MAKTPDEVQVDYISGTEDNDVLWQSDAASVEMHGLGGDDLFMARAAKNGIVANARFEGGAGTDTVSYINSTTRIGADLAADIAYQQWPNGGNWEIDRFDSIENLRGTLLPDDIFGNADDNHLWGEGGNDTIGGRDGDDTLDGGSGADSLGGGDDHDLLLGGSGNDTLKGEADNDTLDGGTGNDILDGGSGSDTALFNTAGNVVVNLAVNLAFSDLGNDTLSSIESVTTGSGADVVYGSTAANTLKLGGGNDYADGGAGNDNIDGGSGADTILGGSGNDTIVSGNGENLVRGGSGADHIVLGSDADTLRYGVGDLGIDEVHAFSLAEDHLSFDLALFGANLAPGGDLADVLMVFDAPGIGSILFAETAASGWEAIARFHGIGQAALEGAIATGSIFYETTGLGGGGPGEVVF